MYMCTRTCTSNVYYAHKSTCHFVFTRVINLCTTKEFTVQPGELLVAQVETLDTFENNRAAAIEVDIFSDTNVRMSVGMHLHVLPGMHVSMCAQAASLIIFHYYVQYV